MVLEVATARLAAAAGHPRVDLAVAAEVLLDLEMVQPQQERMPLTTVAALAQVVAAAVQAEQSHQVLAVQAMGEWGMAALAEAAVVLD